MAAIFRAFTAEMERLRPFAGTSAKALIVNVSPGSCPFGERFAWSGFRSIAA